MLGTVAQVTDDGRSGCPIDAVDHVVRLVEVVQPFFPVGQHGNQDAVDTGVGHDQRGALIEPIGHRASPRQQSGQRLPAGVVIADSVRATPGPLARIPCVPPPAG